MSSNTDYSCAKCVAYPLTHTWCLTQTILLRTLDYQENSLRLRSVLDAFFNVCELLACMALATVLAVPESLNGTKGEPRHLSPWLKGDNGSNQSRWKRMRFLRRGLHRST